MKTTNKAMYPAGARVQEIESLIRGNKPLISAYNEYVRACEEQGLGFFENRTLATNKIKRLSLRVRGSVESALWGAAIADFESGELIVYHVADDPEKIMKTLTEKRSFVKHSGDYEDLGKGFYASGDPGFWKGRSTKRTDILKKLTLQQRENVREYITKERIKGRPGYLTQNERETLKRDVDDFVETGQAGYLSYALNQPVNVDLDEMLKAIGIKPYDPYVIVVRLKGRFFDIFNPSDLLNDLAYLWVEKHYPGTGHGKSDFHYLMKDFQFDGMFQRGYFYNPQIVIWSWKAVIGFKMVKLSDLKLNHAR